MKIIHKYAIPLDEQGIEIELPNTAKVQHTEYLTADKTLYIWIEVPADLKIDKHRRQFKVFKTGDGIPTEAQYVGSAIDHYIPESYHIYEIDE